eukprot:gene38396-46663_t
MINVTRALYFSVLVCLLLKAGVSSLSSLASKDPVISIVFVYIVVPAVCPLGLPSYIKASLSHSILTQPDARIVLATNSGECNRTIESVRSIAGLEIVDSTAVQSQQTLDFRRLSANIFMKDNSSELWLTSALRFFVLEDLMRAKGYKELLHVEADNMLF